jgi:hypothetical protein
MKRIPMGRKTTPHDSDLIDPYCALQHARGNA